MRGPNPLQKFKNIGKITVPYGGQTTQENFHGGVDVAAPSGTPIPAMTDGVVTKAEEGHVQGENNFGNQLEIKDENGNTHQYNHLQGINAQPGEQVQEGEQVATLGDSGATYSKSEMGDPSCLDYRIVTAYGKYKNPLTYLKNV